MPRNYKRKTDREVDEQDMKHAIWSYLKGDLGLNASAERYNIKRTTLQSRIKNMFKNRTKEEIIQQMEDSGNESEDETNIIKYGSKFKSSQVFSLDEEKELSSYIKHCANLNYGLTYHQIQKLAFQYASNLPEHRLPRTWVEKEMADDEWRKGFMKRNEDLSLRKPESTSLMRGTGFNKARVVEFFENLRKVLETHKFKPDRIFNLDETGISTVLKSVKVVSTKGRKQVGQVASAERRETVTFVGIINAAGSALPLVFVFPRLRNVEEYLTDAPPSSLALGNKSGWMTSDLFVKVLEHIVQYTMCSRERKIVLLIDNHDSHVLVDAIVFCREHGIILLSFPPHTTHKLQPLDVAVYAPFKPKLATAQNDWLVSNPGKIISIRQIAMLTKTAYLNTFTPKNITSAFQNTGIWPLNTQIFSDDEFLPSSVTDKEVEESQTLETNEIIAESRPSTSGLQNEPAKALETSEAIAESHPSTPSIPNKPANLPSDCAEASTSNNISILEKIRPYPKIDNNAPKKKKRKIESKSRIYTDTPELLIKQNIQLEKERKKKVPMTKVKRKVLVESSSSESEAAVPSDNDSSGDESFSSLQMANDEEKYEVKDFVLVKFPKKKSCCYFIGQTIKVNDEITVSFLRRKGKRANFTFPSVEDISVVEREDIMAKMNMPTRTGTTRTLGTFRFPYKFNDIDLR